MGMTRRLILLMTIGVLAACGSSAGASSTGSTTGSASAATVARCGPAGAVTLAASSQARVYRQGLSIYACAPGHGAPYRLGSAGSCINSTRIGAAAAAGPIAAYAATQCGIDTGSTTIVVLDVATRHKLAVLGSYSGPAAAESYEDVGSIVDDRSGHAAWIVSEGSIVAHKKTIEVVRRSGAGVQVVASGSTIGLASLRLRGSTISWTAGAVRHTAPLA